MLEVLEWFKRKNGRELVKKVRLHMLSIARREMIHSSEWTVLLH